MNKEKEKEKELAARRPIKQNKQWHNGIKLPPRGSSTDGTFLKLPVNFMSAETSMIFDNFLAIKEGSDIGKRKVEEIKRDYLHCKQEWVVERKGDYLGPKIPSLLEFLENKIEMKEVLGIS